jgi:hypothetical protein
MTPGTGPTRSLKGTCGAWLAAAAVGFAATARADEVTEPVGDTNATTLSDLLKRIDSLERRNKSLEGQVAELKALEGEKWLSQERADQIRGVVSDMLADAETRSNLRQDAMTAGWNDGFFLASPDGRFKLQIEGLVQPRFMWSQVRDNQIDLTSPNGFKTPFTIPDPVESNYGFDSNYNELVFRGHVFSPAVEYMVRTNVALTRSYDLGTEPGNFNSVQGQSASGNLYLLDAWVRIAFADEWSFRFGQYRSPYAREQLVTEKNQMAVSRSTIVRNYGLWYTQGIELQYQGDDFRWNLSVDSGGSANVAGTQLQVMSTSPLNAPWSVQSASYSFTTRLEWKPFGSWTDFNSFTSPMGGQQGLLLGLAFHTQGSRPDQVEANPPSDTGLPENYWDAVTADFQWNMGGASVFGSFFYNYVDSNTTYATNFQNPNVATPSVGNVNAWGFTLQPSLYIAPKWEWYVRYEYGYISFQNTDGLASGALGELGQIQFQNPYNVITTGLNWYIDGQDLKWTIDFGYGITDINFAWQNLPAGWRISASDQFVMRTQLQLVF